MTKHFWLGDKPEGHCEAREDGKCQAAMDHGLDSDVRCLDGKCLRRQGMNETASKYKPQKYENKDPRPDLTFEDWAPSPVFQIEYDDQRRDNQDKVAFIIGALMLAVALLLWVLT
jgi:hypothetical protein